MKKMKLDIQKFADGEITIGLKVDTKSFEAQISKVERELYELDSQYAKLEQQDGFDEQSNEAVELRAKIEKCKNELIKLRQEQDKLDSKKYQGIKQQLDNIGKSTEKNAKKVAKWALAIFGIRSAYMLVRNAINTLSQSDPQLKADIEYIRAALATAIEPVVRKIINLVKQLMTYLAYIIYMWTGRNIFENANKNLQGANKQAKDLKKTLSGFDEMNVLQDTSSAGGGETEVAPSFDLSNIQNIEVPGWIKWIAENKEIVIGALVGIAGAIALIKLGDLISGLIRLKEILTPFGKWIAKNSKTIAGVLLIGEGLILIIRGICQYLKEPTWNNFLTILLGIAMAVGGVAILFGAIPALITAIIGVIVALVVVIIKNWDKIKAVLKAVVDFFKWVIGKIVDFFKGAWDWLKETAENVWTFIKGILTGVANWVKEKVIDPIADLFTGLWDGIKETFTKTWDFIVSAFSEGGKIFEGIGEGILNVFKTIVNALIDGINWVISLPFKGINGLLNTIRNAGVLGVYPFKGLWKQDPLPIPEIPKLAKGGIINMPGRGVAIGGEQGMEGVIPLTDAQQMELLGEAIGKYITINAYITNTMNGRVMSRTLQKVRNESDFAFNR